jgi:hypothetical protein
VNTPSEDTFRVEVTIAAPADVVWRSLREPARIRRWHGWDDDGLDAEIDEIFIGDVTASERERTLVVQGGDTFSLHEQADGRTMVRMVRAPRGTDPDWDAYYEDVNEGWTMFMHQLRFALERHPDRERRTVFLSGRLDGAGEPLIELGLAAAASVPPGDRYSAATPVGTLNGKVWYRSAHQAGLSVDDWGDGLLIVGVAATSTAKPHGDVMAILTTYGLSDIEFNDVGARWTQWWGERYQNHTSEPEAATSP